MQWLTGDWTRLGAVAGKGALMYATALLALRVGERRTLAQWTTIDFATAVAMGAIIGRTAVAGTQSYVTGAVAVLTLVVAHRAVSWLRFTNVVAKVVDHRVRILVVDGTVRCRELRRCGITQNDLYAHLREQGVFDLSTVRYVMYETRGNLTIVPRSEADGGAEPPLVRSGVRNAAGFEAD